MTSHPTAPLGAHPWQSLAMFSAHHPAFLTSSLLALTMAAGCGSASAPATTPAKVSENPAPAEAKNEATQIHGRLLGHDGKPMPMAHVTVAGKAIEVESDGSFEVSIPKPGVAQLFFTGVDHGDYRTPLYVEGGEVTLEVKLGTYPAPAVLENLNVVALEFHDNKPPSLGAMVSMKKDKDGIFRATIPAKAGEFTYEIRGLTKETGRSMNGTARTEFRYDGDGNYVNVAMGVADKPLVIEYDPTKRLPSGSATVISFADAHSRTAQIAKLFGPTTGVQSAGAQSTADLIAAIDQEKDPLLRGARQLAVFAKLGDASGSEDPRLKDLARNAFETLAADSPLWELSPQSLITMGAVAGSEFQSAVLDIVQYWASHDKRRLAAGVALGQLMKKAQANDEDGARAYYALISEQLSDTPESRIARMFNPDRQIRPGKLIPAFSFEDVDSKKTLSNATFAKKVVLIDFWATWCAPCMAEMPNIHATYEKFHDQGFEILSINIDDKPGRSQAMRKAGKFPMPWSNVVLNATQGAVAKRDFEISGLPTAILVGPDGTIVATDLSIRGQGLGKQVAAALGK